MYQVLQKHHTVDYLNNIPIPNLQHGTCSTYNESKTLLQMNVPDAAKSFEESLNILLPCFVWEATQIHTAAAHFGRTLQKQ